VQLGSSWVVLITTVQGAGKSEGNGPIRRPGRTWKDNIKMYLQEIRRAWTGSGSRQGTGKALANAEMKPRVSTMRGMS